MPEITGIIYGVNPARAGMIPEMRATQTFFAGKPRASGDDPATPSKSHGDEG